MLNLVLSRDRHSPQFRFQAVLVFMLVLWLVAAIVEHPLLDTSALREGLGPLGALISPVVVIVAALFHIEVLRHLVVPLIMVVLGLQAGARYIDDLFELNDESLALNYLNYAMLGNGSPGFIEIKDGAVTEATQNSALLRIGGPGYVKIHLGNAALFERVDGQPAIYRAGTAFVNGFERLREVIDLRDQIRECDDLLVYTKDGVPVKVADIRVAFRLWSGEQERTEKNPYPFDDWALRRAVYGKIISAKFQSAPWTKTITSLAANAVARYVASHPMKELVAQKSRVGVVSPAHVEAVEAGEAMSGKPADPHAGPVNPRHPLSRSFYESTDTLKQFKEAGVELLWIDVGTLQPLAEIEQDFINAWQVDSTARARSGEFRPDVEQRRGRAEIILTDVLKNLNDWCLTNNSEMTRYLGGDQFSGSSIKFRDEGKSPQFFDVGAQLHRARALVDLYHIILNDLRHDLKGQPLDDETLTAIAYLHKLSKPAIIVGEEEKSARPDARGRQAEAEGWPSPEAAAEEGFPPPTTEPAEGDLYFWEGIQDNVVIDAVIGGPAAGVYIMRLDGQPFMPQQPGLPAELRPFIPMEDFEELLAAGDFRKLGEPAARETPEAGEARMAEQFPAEPPGPQIGQVYYWHSLQAPVLITHLGQDFVVIARPDAEPFPDEPPEPTRSFALADFEQMLANGDLKKIGQLVMEDETSSRGPTAEPPADPPSPKASPAPSVSDPARADDLPPTAPPVSTAPPEIAPVNPAQDLTTGATYFWKSAQFEIRIIQVLQKDGQPEGFVLERTDGGDFPTGPHFPIRADTFRELLDTGEIIRQN